MGEHRTTKMGKRGRTITWAHAPGFCLNLHCANEENGAVINLWEKNRHESQRWMILPVQRGSDCFRIHYAANPRFVVNLHGNEHSNNAVINLWEENGHESQTWKVKGGILVHAANENFCINVHGALEGNGTEINLWERNGHYSQKWKGAGAMARHSRGSELRLDADNGFTINLHGNEHDNGHEINLWEFNGHVSQRWLFEPIEGWYDQVMFRIRHADNPDFCINLHGNEHDNGHLINLWEVNDHISQMWVMRGKNICHADNPNVCSNLHGMDVKNGALINLWERNGHASQRWKGVPAFLGEDSSSSSSDCWCDEEW